LIERENEEIKVIKHKAPMITGSGEATFAITPNETPDTIMGNIITITLISTSKPFPFFKGCGLAELIRYLTRPATNTLTLLIAIAYFYSN
jgi:hypothetical protein